MIQMVYIGCSNVKKPNDFHPVFHTQPFFILVLLTSWFILSRAISIEQGMNKKSWLKSEVNLNFK